MRWTGRPHLCHNSSITDAQKGAIVPKFQSFGSQDSRQFRKVFSPEPSSPESSKCSVESLGSPLLGPGTFADRY